MVSLWLREPLTPVQIRAGPLITVLEGGILTVDPVYVMRSYILDMESINLAEQAGMFCEALKDACEGDYSLFEGTEFIYSAEEPYEAVFIWDKGDIRAKLTFQGDPDYSTWSVVTPKKRLRGAIGADRMSSCRLFLDALLTENNSK